MSFSDEQVTALKTMIAEGSATAFGEALKGEAFQSVLADLAPKPSGDTDALKAQFAEMKTALEGLKAPPKPKDDGDGAIEVVAAKLRAEYDLKFEELATKEKRTAQGLRMERLGNDARSALTQLGVKTDTDNAFYALRGRDAFKFSDDGVAVMDIPHPVLEGRTKTVPLADGLAHWVKTDGARFVDPADTGGHGRGGSGGSAGASHGNAVTSGKALSELLGRDTA